MRLVFIWSLLFGLTLSPLAEAQMGQTIQEELLDVDPYPVTESKVVVPAKDVARLRLVGRISAGVLKIALRKGGGSWWECGRKYTPDEASLASIEWANRIVSLASEYSDRGSDDGIQINPWEVAAISANESGFDRCIMGKWPRKWAYEHGTITRSRETLSHTAEAAIATITDPRGAERWSSSGFDGSPLHIIWLCTEGKCRPKFDREGLPPIPVADVFTLGKGFEYSVRMLKKTAILFGTDVPSLYWRGSRTAWYHEKIRNWALKMGATEREAGPENSAP